MSSDDCTRFVSIAQLHHDNLRRDCSTLGALREHRGSPGPLFDRLHHLMRAELDAVHRHGVMVFAASSDLGLVGRMWLEATDELRGGTVGRHTAADLSLPWLQTLSLRHLLLLVRRVGQRVHLRAMDLRSGTGFCDERGESLTGLEADGPLVLGVSGWWLYVFPTGVAAPWNASAPSPWQSLPPRIFTQRRGELGAARRLVLVPHGRDDVTMVLGRSGPVMAGWQELLEPGEGPDGLLHVECSGRRASVRVGSTALARGILLGRDSRCDGAGALSHGCISRVHALLLRDENEQLCLLDVGSVNGTWSGGQARRMTPVEPLVPCMLATDAATLAWQPAQ